MSTNNKKQRRDELNKVSGGLGFNGNVMAVKIRAVDGEAKKIMTEESMTTNPRRPEKVCNMIDCN